MVCRPTCAASCESVGFFSADPSPVTTTGSSVASGAGAGRPPRARGRRGGGCVAVGHLVAGQEIADLERPRRPPVADHPGLGRGGDRAGAPSLEERVEHRVQLLLRRIPRLEQVVVQVDDVDGVDGRAGVGVGGEQHAARRRKQVHGLFQELDAGHAGHPVVGDEHRHLLAAQLEFLQRVQRLRARFGPDDPVLLAVAAAQVTGDGTRHAGVVVDGQDRRPRGPVWRSHASSLAPGCDSHGCVHRQRSPGRSAGSRPGAALKVSRWRRASRPPR